MRWKICDIVSANLCRRFQNWNGVSNNFKRVDVEFFLLQYAFCYALYGLHNIVMTCSIYMTVFLAMERYLAVSRPIEYHNSVNSGKRWVRIARYVLPVIIISIICNVPKFYELRPSERRDNVTFVSDDGFNVTEERILDVSL